MRSQWDLPDSIKVINIIIIIIIIIFLYFNMAFIVSYSFCDLAERSSRWHVMAQTYHEVFSQPAGGAAGTSFLFPPPLSQFTVSGARALCAILILWILWALHSCLSLYGLKRAIAAVVARFCSCRPTSVELCHWQRVWFFRNSLPGSRSSEQQVKAKSFLKEHFTVTRATQWLMTFHSRRQPQ